MRRTWIGWLLGLLALVLLATFVVPGGFFGLGGCCGWGGYGGMMGMGGMWGRGGYGGMMGPTAAWGPFMFLAGLIPLLLLGLIVAGGVGLGLALFRRGNPPVGAVAPATAATCPQCGQPVAARWRVCPYCCTELRTPASSPTDDAV